MIGLGLSMMWSSLIVALSALAIRALVAKELDLLSVGIYSAAFSLSGYVVNFVLQAMRADYYPQLSSLCDDNKAMSSLVNEQMEIGILLVFIPILGSLILSPVLVTVFYSLEFQGAVDLLQWFLLGCFGRVVSWPVGFIMLAKGKARVFALVQTLFGAVHVMLVFAGIAYYGIVGAAMAFAILYSFTSLVVYTVGKRLIAFEIYRNTLRLLCVASACVILCFTMLQLLSYGMALLVTLPLFIASVIYDIRQMTFRLGYEHRLVRLLVAFPGVRFILKGI
jgi:PST family polysaccharide transporter